MTKLNIILLPCAIVSSILCLSISIPLYLIIIIYILSHKTIEPYNSGFFDILVALGFVDIWWVSRLIFEYIHLFLYNNSSFLSTLFSKIPYFGIPTPDYYPLMSDNFFATLSDYTMWTLSFAQSFYITLLSINRFTAICLPLMYSKVILVLK